MKTIHADKIRENIELHERIASKYEERHGEIYNEIEQTRLHDALATAVSEVRSASGQVSAFDLGCGAGNLTRHLLRLGCVVTVADVTPSFVRMATEIDPDNTLPFVLNGSDLSEIQDHSYDLIATYSVLHHIPDYLLIIKEMARVLRPGGVLFLDHERSESYWEDDPILQQYFSLNAEKRGVFWYLQRLASPTWWVKKLKKLKDPRYQEEGDIHVWPDDHIEWPKIREVLSRANMEIIRDEDYLHFQSHHDIRMYESFRDKCTDMRLLVARKR